MSPSSLWKLVRLDFDRNPVHFGETGIGLENTTERAHSDTLFSAWVSAYARLFGKTTVENLFARFNEKAPPFRLSSSFIYQQLESSKKPDKPQYVDYLPKPILRPPHYPIDDLAFAKTYRQLNYLPLSVWQRWYQQKGFNKEDIQTLIAYTQDPEKGKEAHSELAAAGTFAYADAYKQSTLPKVSIDRSTRATNFYHTRFIQYAPQAGLYFLVAFPQAEESLLQELQAALLFLGEEGIGGERSSGAGRFTPIWSELPDSWQSLLAADSMTHHSLISLFWAKPDSHQFQQVSRVLNNPESSQTYYSLKARGGWISSPAGHQLRRQVVSMMTEGSVLPKTAFPEPPSGALADVTPEKFKQLTSEKFEKLKLHRIYRSGVSVSVPIALEL
jgi:CRISPR-associated protein Csm4